MALIGIPSYPVATTPVPVTEATSPWGGLLDSLKTAATGFLGTASDALDKAISSQIGDALGVEKTERARIVAQTGGDNTAGTSVMQTWGPWIGIAAVGAGVLGLMFFWRR